jgi:hypothetical protein
MGDRGEQFPRSPLSRDGLEKTIEFGPIIRVILVAKK